ncbi:MAG: hypothetical protein U0Q18_31500 [Bryobacteraceae bacterium]
MKDKFSRSELVRAAVCLIVLAWVNIYICRDFFFSESAHMNSMHGFWAAIARLGADSWLRPTWWPYWDCGIPFEFTYAPLVPQLAAAWSALRGIPQTLAIEAVNGLAYCLAPLTLFAMCWLLTRAPGYSFAAALFYSLTAATQLLVPDGNFSFATFWDARRLFLVSVWDDTPHVLALAMLPLVILFLSLSIRRRRPVYYVTAALCIALASAASAFGPTMTGLATVCLIFALRGEGYSRSVPVVLLVAVLAYAVTAPFMPPSLFSSIRDAAATSEGAWSMGSVTALGLVLIGWVALCRWIPRWTPDWRVQFFAMFAYLTGSIPTIATFLHRQFIPQPNRYKMEMELALAPLVVFALRPFFQKLSRPFQAAVLVLVLGLGGEQIVSHRKFAKNVLYPANPTKTVEHRTAQWIRQNLPGVRVMLPGSIGSWADAFADIPQLSGSSWSMAYNPVQQRAVAAIWNGGASPEEDAKVSLAYLQAYGAGAIAVSGPKSAEFWKPYAHPTKFEGVLPVLWREDDVTIYQVPQRTSSFAHVLPNSAIVGRAPRYAADTAGIDRYVSALQDPALPAAGLEWEGRNRIRIRTNAASGQAISVQVSYNPGWKATVNGHRRPVRKDGLGLMWIDPGCNGPCDVQLDYAGSWEVRLCRWLSVLGILAMAGLLLRGRFRRVSGSLPAGHRS